MLSSPRPKLLSSPQASSIRQLDQKAEPTVRDLTLLPVKIPDLTAKHHNSPEAKRIALDPAPSIKPEPINHPTSLDLANSPFAMSDGLNEARALRVMEIMNDFRTLQIHINSLITRSEASPPDQESYYLDGYVVLRQCAAESQAVLAGHFNPGNLGLQSGNIPETEVQKASLQRIILDASTRRFQAHKIYLRGSAATRWVQLRTQLLRGEKPGSKHANGLRTIDQRLRQELSEITDDHVYRDLRNADQRKRYWLDEDPVLERMLGWIRMQR
ncbi:hypothetical protein Z517_11681 [Fonsecaea pedrosoi CBS 271.37]|uniref:Uncharacterized protein n=1 Tax=Fonsecaea pedrosoi CBS 271.37 TaxID=1442368 RepID=A0A0D2G860_9EURO|nr:uncharacterized protein Z517_11681 [Fonsecaea pedrosoi CBS 271.37]KIW74910.1 hypothetical protein Z517_11681 [Fonsecaea pedrosoi CBS 271.37]